MHNPMFVNVFDSLQKRPHDDSDRFDGDFSSVMVDEPVQGRHLVVFKY